MSASHDRRIAQILAFAARQFDAVRDVVVKEGDEWAAAEPAPTPDKPRSSHAAVRAAGVALGAAKAAQKVVLGVHPAHPKWASSSLDHRISWWVQRFGTVTAAIAAVPGLGGRLGKITGIGDVVGAAAQMLVVNAVAREMGVDDLQRRVQVSGRIVLGRDLDLGVVKAGMDDEESRPDSVPESDDDVRASRFGALGRGVWRVAEQVVRLRVALGRRPGGGAVSQVLSNFPVVGAPAAFVSERSGIAKAAQQARGAFGDS